jgi:putative transcriptional regulator
VPRNREPDLNNCIRELRASEDGMTQQILADQVGVTRQTVVALEGGAYTPSLALALRISYLFDKTVEEVFWIDES